MSHLGTTLYARSWRSLVPTHLVPGRGVGIVVAPARSKVRASKMVSIGCCIATGLGTRCTGLAAKCSLRRLGGNSLACLGTDAEELLLAAAGGRGLAAMETAGAGSVDSAGTVCSAGAGTRAGAFGWQSGAAATDELLQAGVGGRGLAAMKKVGVGSASSAGTLM